MIGAPVSSVRTPPLLRDYLAAQGVNADVSAIEVAPTELVSFVQGIRADESIDGLLVTMPHKRTIAPLLDGLSDVAQLSASVNTVKRTAGSRLIGGQFDGIALVRALVARGAQIGTSRIIVAGLGGAGAAIAHALVAHGCQSLDIFDINQRSLDALFEDLRACAECPVVATDDPATGTYDILVNATPLGMQRGDPSPFGAESVARAKWIADIVADPLRTRLGELARQMGKTLITGRQVVECQMEPIGDWLLAST